MVGILHLYRQRKQNRTSEESTTAAIMQAPSRESERRFLALVSQWKRDRGPYSSSAKLADHPAYRQIIALADLERITAGAFNAHLTEAAGVAR